MTDSKTKITAIVFAALMITSVAAAGVVAAASSTRGGATFDSPADSTGNVGPGAVIYQGEDGLTFTNGLDDPTNKPLIGVQDGGADGTLLDQVPVPDNQETGRYTEDGNTGSQGVTVTSPNVNTLEIVNERGVELDSDASVEENQNLVVVADWNYKRAEDVKLTVEDSDGFEITGTVLNSSTPTSAQQTYVSDNGGSTGDWGTAQQGIGNTNLGTGQVAAWHLDFEDVESGTYTIMVEGIDDFEDGEGPSSAVDSQKIDLVSEDDAQLDFATEEATQGEQIRFDIVNGVAGENHYVAIENGSEIRQRRRKPAQRNLRRRRRCSAGRTHVRLRMGMARS
ncbi:MAG: hypothetical protein SXQ77_06825 [Halobacteria archaeon]|nr:hypothetical protein [Halobacteria archaeon]